MPPTPLVSIVIPAYKVEKYLDKCLSSVIDQTERNIEVLVVDDASPDSTRQVIEHFAATDARVRPILLAKNGGVCNARNAALDLATGDWVAIVDSDDWLSPHRLARMVAVAQERGADIVIDDQYFIREGAAAPCARLLLDEPAGASPLDAVHFVTRDRPEYMGYGLAKPLIRRGFLDDHNIRYRLGTERYEDFLILIECFAKGATAALLNEPLYYYLLRGGSLSAMDQIKTMEGLKRQNDRALAVAREADAKPLVRALERRGALILKGLRYYTVVTPLKKRDLTGGLAAMAKDPAIGPYVAEKFAIRLWHRLRRQDPLALALLPGAKLAPGN